MNYKVNMPEIYLIHIASSGKMGSGELMNTMKHWAYNECVKFGLKDKVREMQEKHISDIKARLTNVLGEESMKKINEALEEATEFIRSKKK